jgi:hypothetical protein
MGDISEKFPRTVNQAVSILLAELSTRNKTKIANMSEDDLIQLNFSLGLYIRNEFRVWGNDPLIQSCSSVSGIKEIHPNFASLVIIKALWEKLQNANLLKLVK